MATAGYGALSGLGQGIAMVGQNMLRDEDAAQRKQLMQERQMALLEARLAAKGAGGGSAQPNGNLSFEQLQALAADPKTRGALRVAGGMDPAAAGDLATMEAGGAPTITAQRGTSQAQVRAFDNGASTTEVSAPKYAPGQETQVYQQGYQALRRALGLMNVGHAKAIADAEGEEQQNAFARRAATGDPEGIRGALATAGKDVLSNEGTDMGTGLPNKGSVAEARRGELGAQAGKFSAEADKLRAEASGDLTKQRPESLTATLNAINGLIKSYDEKSLNDEDVKARRQLQALATRISGVLTSKFGITPEGGAPAPGPAPAAADKAPQAPLDAAAREVGKTYQTPRGPLVWMGNGWKKP